MITIIIPTLNRAELMAECLRSLAEQDTSLRDWAVIVVDNASTDSTRQVVEAAQALSPRITYLYEPVLGASRARNAGLMAARTPYVIFIDSDTTCPPGYVEAARQLIEAKSPICFGGPILACHSSSRHRPGWFRDAYASFSMPQDNRPDELPNLSGGNLGCDREALKSVGGFDERYGPVGTQMNFCEDTLVVGRLADRFGTARIFFDEAMVNYHAVHAEDYSWRHIVIENFLRGVARGRLSAEACMKDAVVLQPKAMSAGLKSNVTDAFHDLLLKKSRQDLEQFPSAQSVIYERWMGYVRQLGVLVGRLAPSSRGTYSQPPSDWHAVARDGKEETPRQT